ncbi:MAG: response regulator [Treponema sp.]|jgi:two-component system response regulator YesN|nr:response regulator [Treponema sp.]
MYRILVVDDEDIITDSLAHMLESDVRFELDVYKAYSAVEALERLEKMSFDIVITDIQMPGRTGIELLKDIHTSWPDCQVIFLTGYNEFEYAVQAIKYHAARYILKTEGYEPLLAAVTGCIETIEKESRNTALLEKAKEQVNRYLPLVRQNFLGSILSGDTVVDQSLTGDFKRLEISLNAEAPVMLLAARLGSPASAETVNSVNLAVRKKISGGVHSELAWTGANIISWIMQYRSAFPAGQVHARAMLKAMAEYVQRFCASILHETISFVLELKPTPWREVSEKFAELKFMVTNRLEPHIALAEMEYFLGEPFGSNIQNAQSIAGYKEGLKKLTFALNLDDAEKTSRISAELVHSIGTEDTGGIELLEFNTLLNGALLSYITERGLSETVKDDSGLRLFLSDGLSGDRRQRLNQFSALACRLIQLYRQRKNSGNALSGRILSYMRENPGADLSLYTLSEKVFLNPSYLSRRFKEETGKNITAAVLDIRLTEACRLLRETERKINQVAAMVGYESPAYFSNVFKRKFGMTPQEYRDRKV